MDSNSLLHGLVIAKSLNYVDEQWKKIIQLGKKSLTSMPFHYIAPSPFTALVKGFTVEEIFEVR